MRGLIKFAGSCTLLVCLVFTPEGACQEVFIVVCILAENILKGGKEK